MTTLGAEFLSTLKTRTSMSMLPKRSSKVAKNAFPEMSKAAIVRNMKSSVNPGIIIVDVIFVMLRTRAKFARTV